ncbi:MAG: acyl carrier protein, partial [Deltaproteobacteria bacterium]|nr:acyl carrier protein [Deltaproteobacteria bacterium]
MASRQPPKGIRPTHDNSKITMSQQLHRSAIDAELVRICRKIFDGRNVSITDDFFDLGGNSITAIKLISEVEKQFG